MSTSSLLLLLLSLCGSCYCTCPESWVQYGKSCYFYNQQLLPWVEAHEACEILGSHLVEIMSDTENNFVKTLLINKPVGYAWIGIIDMLTEGKWALTSTRKPVVYTNWGAGEPNNLGKIENCGGIYNTGFWNDESCEAGRIFPSVCQKPV